MILKFIAWVAAMLGVSVLVFAFMPADVRERVIFSLGGIAFTGQILTFAGAGVGLAKVIG